MNKKIMKRLMCLMVLIALAGGLIIMPVKVMATVVTPDETEQTEETEQAKSPITPTNEVMNETEDAAEGVTAETPEISGITIESDNDDEEDETKPAYTLKAKIKVSAAAKTMSDAEVVVGEQEPDGKVYVKATAYVNQGELRDAIGAGSIKISKKLESSDGTWKPTPGQNYVVAVRGYSKVYNESGQYKWGTTGYKKTYKISAAKRRAQKKREAKKRRLTLRRKNQKNRLIYQSTNYYFDEGEAYSIPELMLSGYTMTAESKAKLTGTMGSEDATVDLAYEGDEVPINIAYVDYSGDAVSEAYSSTGIVGESYSVVSPTPEGFVLANDYYGTISGTVTAGGVDKKVYYSEEKYWLVINHLDENGNELYPQADSYELKPGTEYSYDDTTSSGPIRSFDGYTLVDGDFTTEEVDNGDGTKTTKKVIKGTMPKEKKELTLNYVHNKEAVKINFKYVGVNGEMDAPDGMPTEPYVETADSWTDILYEPDEFEGWQLVGTYDKGGYAKSWYDTRKNLITVPGASWEMLGSSEAEPYELTYTYYQVVPAELDFQWDGSQTGENAPATDVPAEAKTINVLAGSAKTTDLPQVDGYVCSRGTQTTIKANDWVQDTDGTVYYSPYKVIDNRKIVSGTPGEATYKPNWDPVYPDAPYTIDVNVTFSAGMDKDEKCSYSGGGSFGSTVTEVYIGGDMKGGVFAGSLGDFQIDTGSKYFKKNHDNYEFTVYEERELTGVTVWVETKFTVSLPLTPLDLEGKEDDPYKVVDLGEVEFEPSIQTHQYSSSGSGWGSSGYRYAFDYTKDQDSSFEKGALTWTFPNDKLEELGINPDNLKTYNYFTAVRAIYKDRDGKEKTALLNSTLTKASSPEGTTAFSTSDTWMPADAIGEIRCDLMTLFGGTWFHGETTITRNDWPNITGTETDLVETDKVTNKGYNKGDGQVDGVVGPGDVIEVEWSDSKNIIETYSYGEGAPRYYWDAGYAYNNLFAANGTVAGITTPGFEGNRVFAGNKPVGYITKIERVTDEDDITSDNSEVRYKATIRINRAVLDGNLGKNISFTLWNQGIGTLDTEKSTDDVEIYKMYIDNVTELSTKYQGEGPAGDLNYYFVVRNMKTTVTATLTEDLVGAYTENDYSEGTVIDESSSTLDTDGNLNIKWSVPDALKDAANKENARINYSVYVINCEEDDDDNVIMPKLERGVFAQAYYESENASWGDPTETTCEGNNYTLDTTLITKNRIEAASTFPTKTFEFMPGCKYKVALVMNGYTLSGEGDDEHPEYFTATSYATLTAGEKPAFVDVSDFEITKATVAKTYDYEGNKYPEINLEWKATVNGLNEETGNDNLGFYVSTNYYSDNYDSKDVRVSVDVYDVDKGRDPDDYGITSQCPDQREHTLSLKGGNYRAVFSYGSGTPTEIMSGRYVASVTYTWKTYDKYGAVITKTKTVTKDIKTATATITDEDVLFQVDNAGSALVRVSGDRKLVRNDIKSDVNPTATIWYDGKKYDEVALASEATDRAENYKNWYAWVDLGDGYGKALDATKLKVTISGKDYDANTFDSTKKYDAVAKDFVTITKAKEKNGKFNLAYKMAIPNSSFRAVSTYWNLEGESDVEADAGAVVKTEDQKIDIYSSDVIYEGSAYKDSETGLYFGKFKSLDGKKVNVKVYNHNKDVVFTSSAVIGSEGATTATDDVVVTSATYDINGNVTLAGTFDNEAVTIKSWNNYYMYVEGADGESYSTSLSESSDGVNGFVVDPDAGTFSYTGKAFTPSGNSIFGYTLREFAGLSDKNLKVSVSLNKVESDQVTFTYTDEALTVSDSMIKEVTEDGADYLQVSLPRGYYANTVDIGGVIATAKEGSKGLKFASAEDDVEFTFDAATVTSMTGEGDALLSVSKYTGTMPANVTTSGLKAMAAYELGFSWSYTGNMKVRLTSEAELTEGGVPTVYYVSSDGTATEEMATTYSINQYDEVEAVFATPHNSTFVVVYKGQLDAEDYATVTFDANGGTGTMDPQVVVKGDATELKANTFTRDGFTFAGWAESKDATAVKYADKAKATFDADITLYAVWKESGSSNNEQGGGSGQNEQGGSSQSGQGGDSGQTTTPITETPAAPAVTGSTVSDATSGAEYVVTTEAGSKQTVEYKVPTVAMSQTTILIPATVVVNGTQYEVTSIADKAFKDNTTVTSITIGENVETIGESAFEGCTSLTSITIPASVTTVGDSAFEGCTKLKTATMAKGVTEIGTKAFANCTSLTKIKVPETVTKIGDQAFSGDKKLKSATIGNNVTEIGDKAFANCSSLTSITIPKKVNKLGANVFKGDKKLKTITVKNTKLNSKNVSKNAFKGISNKTVIKVPKSKKKAYTTLFRKKGLSKKVKIK